MTNNEKLTSISRNFGISGKLTNVSIFTDGHINSTFCAEFSDGAQVKKYLIQGINTFVFKDQDLLMDNIVGVTEYLRKKIAENGGDVKRETLHFLKAKDGKYYYRDGETCWRIYDFVDNTYTYNIIDSNKTFENVGKSFGIFQRLLNGYPCERLGETIPDFHNTPKRIENLEKAVKEDVAGRAEKVDAEIKFVLSKRELASHAVKLLESGEVPLRVTHNDTKVNNILFDKETHNGICVIDLDTIMPGISLYDFGDAIRSGASTASEDETDLSKVSVSFELYESYVKGYLSGCMDILTEAEIQNLAYGAWLMTFECGVRFLTDYLQGDVYFKIVRPLHNLDRARNQFKLACEIENNLEKLNKITMCTYEQLIADKNSVGTAD